ncbi:MAG TPA: hypothetical protein VFZ98_08225 [Vicinamibacterales bacterium]
MKLPRTCCCALLALQLASVAYGQATVPDRGEATLSVTYQHYDVVGHFDAHGNENSNGSTQSQVLVTDLDYGMRNGFALVMSLPVIASKYTGPPSYSVGPYLTFPGPLDDGRYHAALQDVRLELRRGWWAGPVPIAPFVGFSFPTHRYETVGEAVPGRHRRDLQVGASAGVDLGRVLRGAYVEGRYAYGAMQRINNLPFTRSNIDVEAGADATSRILVRGLVGWQIRHTGPSLDQLAPDWVNHDRFIAPSYLNVGGGPLFSVSRSTDVFALLVAAVAGSNGAHRQRTIAIGVTFGFGSSLHGLGGANRSDGRRSDAARFMEQSP